MIITKETIKNALWRMQDSYDYSHADNEYHITINLEDATTLIYDMIKSTKERYSSSEKEIPRKPHFNDTHFRQLGKKYGELVDIQPIYNCPRCNTSLWLYDKFERCTHCGQALDWKECKYNEHLERWV